MVDQGYYEGVTGKNIADNRSDPGLPIESVNRDPAFEFCRLLSARAGREIRQAMRPPISRRDFSR